MPHQCTNCGRTFDDGSKEMLSGCPDCGGNKFQFIPAGADPPDPAGAAPPESPEPSAVTRTAARATANFREWVGTGEDDPDDSIDPVDDGETEDRAQAAARSGVVGDDELPPVPDPEPERETANADDDRPDLAELREELNDQFESIKIVDHGRYELNLMELYEREEYIIALRENGRYVIEVPESLHDVRE